MLTVVGLNHLSAPIDVRERVAISDASLPDALRSLGQGVILSTCNRTEIYQTTDAPVDREAAAAFLGRRLGLALPEAERYLYRLAGEAAVRHLYAVAAGLDSLVLGEAQILGQVRAALAAAESAGTASLVLRRAFGDALRVGRRARAETFIGRHATSVSYAAVELARSVFGRLAGRRAVVVGAGETGELTTRILVDHGVEVLAVANRTLDRARALASRFGADAVDLEALGGVLRHADLVISSTEAPHAVIACSVVQAALERRERFPLVLVDIAVPRDVDPAVRSLAGVVLYDIDDLKARCDHNRSQRQGEVQLVQQIIDEEAARFAAWLRAREVTPAIVALRNRAEQARQIELAEALGRLEHLDAADRKIVDDLTRALVNKLLHDPTVRLKELAVQGRGDLTPGAHYVLGLAPAAGTDSAPPRS